MIDWLCSLIPADSQWSFLRVLNYVSVRAALALGFAFVFCLVVGDRVIERLRRLQAVQYVRVSSGENAVSLHEMHSHKGGVPTMGGVLILGAVVFAALMFGQLSQPALWLCLLAAAGFAAIGMRDDYLKVVQRNSHGLSAPRKLLAQVLLAGAFALLFVYLFPSIVQYEVAGPGNPGPGVKMEGPDFLIVPFFKFVTISLGVLFIPFVVIVLTGTSNAVNLTDGLDGLATGVTISAALCFALVAYLAGRVDASAYLYIPYLQGGGELTVMLAALVGACFGFLWFNAHPAQVFMGDTGSMMLGGMLGAVALLVKHEFLLLIAGGIFVAEALSVILQVGSYKLRGKRIFRMAPLHHHFERGGMAESKIIARFWIISALLALAGLMTLKIR